MGVAQREEQIKKLFIGRCNIFVKEPVIDKKTGQTQFEEVALFEDEPCRLSFYKNRDAIVGKIVPEISQGVKLFLDKELEIKPGSKIIVTQHKTTTAYQKSGLPMRYECHQEIHLELFERYA